MLDNGLLQLLATVEFGSYISIWKVVVILLLVLIWARLLTWVDKDTVAAHMARVPINIGNMLGFVLAFALFLLVPNFLLGLAVFLFLFIVETGVYLAIRHQKVGLADLKKQFVTWITGIFSRGDKEVVVSAGSVMLFDKKGQPMPPPEDDDPDRAAYVTVQEILADPLRKGAEKISISPQDNAIAMRFSVDGMTMNGPSLNKTDSAAAITYIKQALGLDVEDKRKPQTASMRVNLLNKRIELRITTSGSTAGEAMSIEVNPKQKYDIKLDDLGFGADDLELVTKVALEEPSGVVLLSAPQGQGLTTLLYGVLRRHDAFLSHIHTIERGSDTELEGITANPLPANASGAEEAKLVSWVVSQQPDVIMISKLEDPKSVAELIKSAEEHRVYVGMRAGSTFDALNQWRKLVGNDRTAMKNLKLVVNGRVARKLCMACKVEYAPDPETLRRLNMPPERVGKLFQARTQPLRDPKGNPMICEFCQDLRFKGRIGVYEVFLIDDEVRQIVEAGGSVNQLKMVFKKQKRRYLQEQALMRAVEGETSLQEVARVLRIGTESEGGQGTAKPVRPTAKPPSAGPRVEKAPK